MAAKESAQKDASPTPSSKLQPGAYTTDFLNSLIQPLAHPASRPTKVSVGLRIIPTSSSEAVKSGKSIRYEDVDQDTLPDVKPDELPLPLDDARRKYASGIAGVRFTHPGGAIEGGPGPYVASEAVETPVAGSIDKETSDDLYAHLAPQVRAFLREHDISSPEQLREVVKREYTKQVEVLRKRMAEREEAKDKNEDLQEKIDELVAEREMERRVHERARKARGGG